MTSLDLKNRSGTLAVAIAALAAASVFGADAAMAGADTTFNTALAQFTGFLEGSGGRIITVLSLAGGIVALASLQVATGVSNVVLGWPLAAALAMSLSSITVSLNALRLK